MLGSWRIVLPLAFSAATLATEPAPAPATAARPATAEPKSPAPAAPAAAKAPPADATPQATPSAGIDASEERRLRSMGYRPEKQHGELVWCRVELAVGSRFPQKTCTTAAQHADRTRDSREEIDRIQRNQWK